VPVTTTCRWTERHRSELGVSLSTISYYLNGDEAHRDLFVVAPGDEVPVKVALEGRPLSDDVSLENLPDGWTSQPGRKAVERGPEGAADAEFLLRPVGAGEGDVEAFDVVVDGSDPPRRVTAQVLVAPAALVREAEQAVLAACQQDYDAGYRAFKLKIGRSFKWMPRKEGLQRDIEVTHAVKERFPDCRILVDANDAFAVDEAIKYVQSVADCDLYWIEEPFEEDYDSLKRLKDAMAKVGCRALIADGERRKRQAKPLTRHGGYVEEFTDRLYCLAEAKLVDVFVLDLGIVGFARWRKLMPALVKAGIKASPHLWMWTPRTYYCAQLAAGVGNVCIIEGIPGQASGIDYSAYKITDGKLVVPDTPGFGLKLV